MIWPTRAYLRHLEAEITWLKSQYAAERERANRATDALLNTRVAVGSILAGPTRAEQELTETEVERLRKDPEFTRAGSVE